MAKTTKAIKLVSLTTQYQADKVFGPWLEAGFQISVLHFYLNNYQSKLVIKINLFCIYE
jgi:hypothetical protein